MNFYTAGYLVLHGQKEALYPAEDATSFKGSRFDIALHQLFPTLPESKLGTYPYSPLVAVISAPLALFPANVALFLWQLFNIFGLLLYSILASAREKFDKQKFFFFIFCFLPLLANIWHGQSSIVFGALPLCFGFLLLSEKKDLNAGLVWSLCMLKPQYLPVPFITAFVCGRKKCVAGLLIGTMLIGLLSVFCLGPAIFHQWVSSGLRLAETLFSGDAVVLPNLVACVPGSLIIGLPPGMRGALKWLIYGSCFAVAALGLGAIALRIRKRLSDKQLLSMALLVNIMSLPLYSRLLVYDLSIYVVAAQIVLFDHTFDNLANKGFAIKIVAIATFLALNLQIIVATTAAGGVARVCFRGDGSRTDSLVVVDSFSNSTNFS